MLKRILFFMIMVSLLIVGSANAWVQIQHKVMVADALDYMGSSYATADQQRAYQLYVNSAGGLEEAKELLGQAAYDGDSLLDTRMGGWWTGYHYTAGDMSLGLVNNNYTSFWHFITMTRGEDDHGNDRGGYDYRYHTEDPSYFDNDAITHKWLYNQELKDADYNTTEAHYRLDSYSNKDQYEDYQDIPWQPIDNMGYYWFKQFAAYPTYQSLGYAIHAAQDAGVTHHTWNTLDNYHTNYEEWASDYYNQENLVDFEGVNAEIDNYSPTDDFRNMVTRLAESAYQYPELLSSESHSVRLNAASALMPKTIAITVSVLTKGANVLYGEDTP